MIHFSTSCAWSFEFGSCPRIVTCGPVLSHDAALCPRALAPRRLGGRVTGENKRHVDNRPIPRNLSLWVRYSINHMRCSRLNYKIGLVWDGFIRLWVNMSVPSTFKVGSSKLRRSQVRCMKRIFNWTVFSAYNGFIRMWPHCKRMRICIWKWKQNMSKFMGCGYRKA